MAKGKMLYQVVVYVGDFYSHDTKTVYTCSKESGAEKFLHKYLKEHKEVCKAYIEKSVNMRLHRNRYELDED